ncbi:CopD family protein [Flavobacteriaceae bacterium Ap0902]|nr:CopD family protein [Flavobacteriaceae bacterium Ap0902]
MDYLIFKAIHIIFVVSYFAGLFYIVRLFIYHTEALEGSEPEQSILHKQYSFMEERLWNIITVPAFIIMLITGIYMLYATDWGYLSQGWMHVKLLFVVLLIAYHFWCWKTLKKLHQAKTGLKSVQLRMMNEVATLILFAVVFAVVLKQLFIDHWYWALIAFVGMGVLIMFIVKIVNRHKA